MHIVAVAVIIATVVVDLPCLTLSVSQLVLLVRCCCHYCYCCCCCCCYWFIMFYLILQSASWYCLFAVAVIIATVVVVVVVIDLSCFTLFSSQPVGTACSLSHYRTSWASKPERTSHIPRLVQLVQYQTCWQHKDRNHAVTNQCPYQLREKPGKRMQIQKNAKVYLTSNVST